MIFQLLQRRIGKNATKKSNNNRRIKPATLLFEPLERRELLSVNSTYVSNRTLVISTDSLSTSVEVSKSGTSFIVTEVGTSRKWTHTGVDAVTFVGGDGNDRFVNKIAALPTKAYGNGGNDYLEGNSGNDRLEGGKGVDTLVGGAGADILLGGDDNDTISGGAGNDEIAGNGGNDTLDGGDNDDKLWGGDHNDTIKGGAGNDQLMGEAGDDTLDGGAGNDKLWGGANNDKLIGGADVDELMGEAGDDTLDGGAGNDKLWGGANLDTLTGGAGDDMLWGGTHSDTLLGGDGNDQLMGEDGDDRLNGGAGTDKMWGGNHDDVLIAIDAAFADFVQGDAGDDIIWIDGSGSSKDGVAGATSADTVQTIASFANGADRTLNGDRITDPKVAVTSHKYKQFTGIPLYSANGPSPDDVRQRLIADCYFLAGLSAIALDNPESIRERVVDFDDGTYGVRLGDKFYRVDNDLPVEFADDDRPAYAQVYNKIDETNSMWAAVVEKAFAHYRRGENSYASIEWGNGTEPHKAFGSTSSGSKSVQSYSSATALANDMHAKWSTFQAATIAFHGDKKKRAEGPLVTGHVYTVMDFKWNSAGTAITHVILRNPWGTDGGDPATRDSINDGLVTVTTAELMNYDADLYWGRT